MTYTVTVTWPAGATVRNVPSTTSNGLRIIAQGMSVKATELVPDKDSPADKTKQWAHIEGGAYIATQYPNAKGPQVRATVTDDGGGQQPPPPLPTTATITSHIELNIDGAIYSGDGTLTKL